MLKILAILFGLIFIIIGILGFLPEFKTDGLLFGYFMVNPMHNVVNLVTGIIALVCGLIGSLASKIFFILFGLIFLGAAIYGFYMGSGMILDLIAINQADNIFYLCVAAIWLYFGFFLKGK